MFSKKIRLKDKETLLKDLDGPTISKELLSLAVAIKAASRYSKHAPPLRCFIVKYVNKERGYSEFHIILKIIHEHWRYFHDKTKFQLIIYYRCEIYGSHYITLDIQKIYNIMHVFMVDSTGRYSDSDKIENEIYVLLNTYFPSLQFYAYSIQDPFKREDKRYSYSKLTFHLQTTDDECHWFALASAFILSTRLNYFQQLNQIKPTLTRKQGYNNFYLVCYTELPEELIRLLFSLQSWKRFDLLGDEIVDTPINAAGSTLKFLAEYRSKAAGFDRSLDKGNHAIEYTKNKYIDKIKQFIQQYPIEKLNQLLSPENRTGINYFFSNCTVNSMEAILNSL